MCVGREKQAMQLMRLAARCVARDVVRNLFVGTGSDSVLHVFQGHGKRGGRKSGGLSPSFDPTIVVA